MTGISEVEFFYDYSSPFAYLGSTQIERVARERGATVVFKPFLLGALFKTIGTPLVPLESFPEAKQRYQLLDMKRWAAHWDVPLLFPSEFPIHSVAALRVTLAAPSEARSRLTHRIMQLCWADDGVPDEDALRTCLADVDLDPDLFEKTKDSEVKKLLFAATEEAVERGVCGAPTFIVGDELFWGQDRLHFVAEALG